MYNIHNYSLNIVLASKFFTINSCNNINTDALSMAIKPHNRNANYRNHHKNVGKRYRNLKTTSHYHNLHLLLYEPAEHFPSSLGRFLECRKCNTLVITQALVLCLIYMHSPEGAACPQASCAYIRQSTLACVITYTYIAQYS